MTENELRELHTRSSNHIGAITESELCACFHCQRRFQVARIKKWIDSGTTALCPVCGIDAVLPGPVPREALAEMYDFWFERA